MKITSKSQLKKYEKFNLSKFKTPFCYKEIKKYRIYEMPKFSSKFFKNEKIKRLKEKTVFLYQVQLEVENHLVLSMLDGHPDLDFEIGEDDMLRTIFLMQKLMKKKQLKILKIFNFNYLIKLSGQPKFGKGMGVNKWGKLYNMNKKRVIKTKVWSGNQRESEAHITDFQDIVQRLIIQILLKHLKQINQIFKIVKIF